MPAKRFQFGADARQSILQGASILADAVHVTLGPKSKSVFIEKKFGGPIVCDDGMTIAKEVASAVVLTRGLTRGLEAAGDSSRAPYRSVTNKREKAQVITISAHGDSIAGDMVAQAVEKFGAGRAHYREGIQDHRDFARKRRGHAIRLRLCVPFEPLCLN